jgi:hypothetical protein
VEQHLRHAELVSGSKPPIAAGSPAAAAA